MSCNTHEQCTPSKSVAHFRPVVDVFENEAGYQIIADVPGSAADAIDLDFDRNTLTLTARAAPRAPESARAMRTEYQVGDYRRVFRFDEPVDAESATAEFTSGVLTIRVPKPESARKRRVQVTAS